MGDTRRLAGIEVVDAGCIKGRHGHDAAGRLQGGKRHSGRRLRADGRGGHSRLNGGSPMLNALRSTTPQREPGMAGAEELPIMGPADPHTGKRSRDRFGPDRITGTSHRTDFAAPAASCGRVRR